MISHACSGGCNRRSSVCVASSSAVEGADTSQRGLASVKSIPNLSILQVDSELEPYCYSMAAVRDGEGGAAVISVLRNRM